MFMKNEPVMKVGKYLVIADVHIGITHDLWKAGVSLPNQVRKMADKLNKLKRLTGAKGLIIVGDLKHKTVGISYQERREVPEFLAALKFKKIIIVKGNHDGFIEKLVDDKRVIVRKSFSVGDYIFTHGHRNVKTTKDKIVIGHNHLCVKFRDDVGATYNEPVWVRGKVRQKDAKGVMRSKTIIIMPAFNDLCGYFVVNKGTFNGPIAGKMKNPKIYLLDGTDIGHVDDLKVKE
ncbi:MAG: metallophosphoesterase [Candidatus Aenigmarchaeota archaeon]|nr:metallophosphoesterase [Candidatus Aenigmarchaeota archaeon]